MNASVLQAVKWATERAEECVVLECRVEAGRTACGLWCGNTVLLYAIKNHNKFPSNNFTKKDKQVIQFDYPAKYSAVSARYPPSYLPSKIMFTEYFLSVKYPAGSR